MMNYQKVSNLILRYGLALTYIFSGIDLILHPRSWSSFVPYWFANLLPIDVLTYIQFQGVVEIFIALAFITGIWMRPAAFISALEMIAILILYGIDAVTFRDLAILGGSLALFFYTFTPAAQTAKAASPAVEGGPPAKEVLSKQQKRLRIILVAVAFLLFSIILIGLFWLSNTTKDQAGWLAFSYATGLSMIVLPCTLPLAFVIVPLAMGKDPKKGLIIAFSFALGITITLSLYGALIAKLGQVVGLDRAKDTMYLIAGVFAVIFGFGELGLIKLRVPTYSGAFPKFIQDRKDAMKGLTLGLLLGNVGLGCPNPAFYVLLSHIATVGSMGTGWFLTFIHAVGRVTPLLLLAILAVLGVDALTILMKKREALTRGTAWGVVGVGAFILTFGLLGHDWYVYSGIHALLEKVTQEASFMTSYADKFGGIAHSHGLPTGKYLPYGSWIMVTLIVVPMLWYWRKKKRETPQDNPEAVRATKWFGAYTITFSVLLYLLFAITLPGWLRYVEVPKENAQHAGMNMAAPTATTGNGGTSAPTHIMPGGAAMSGMDMSNTAMANLDVKMNVTPALPKIGAKTTLEFRVTDKDTGLPVTNVELAHGKIMHLVGVRKEDLNKFLHIHPEVKGDLFTVSYTFTDPGTYSFWPEFTYQGMMYAYKQELVVGTSPAVAATPSPEKQQKMPGDVVVTLKTPLEIYAGQQTMFGFSITNSGGFDVPLGMYLEANAHVNVISEDVTDSHHLHALYGSIGMDHEMIMGPQTLLPVKKPFALINTAFADAGHTHTLADGTVVNQVTLNPKDLGLQMAFPKAGNYKIFAEFVTADEPNNVRRAEFWVNVMPAPAVESNGIGMPRWLIILISIILIAAVMPLIFRYLNEEKIKV